MADPTKVPTKKPILPQKIYMGRQLPPGAMITGETPLQYVTPPDPTEIARMAKHPESVPAIVAWEQEGYEAASRGMSRADYQRWRKAHGG